MVRRISGLVGVMIGLCGLVQAQVMEGHDMHDMVMPAVEDSSSVDMAASAAETSSTKAFKAIDAKMHKDMMAAGYTGDADVDFLRNMIPHHQGAVDMANVVLKYGTDADVRMLAGDVVKAQENEIRWMKNWLMKHGPKDAAANDAKAGLAVPDAVSVPSQMPQPVVKNVATPEVPVIESKVVATAGATVTPTLVASPTLVVTSSLPPVDKVSATTAMVTGNIKPALVSGIPDPMAVTAMPDMPAADAEIQNTAPKMEFLDGPVGNGAEIHQ